jgi:hypothetical protein
VAAQRTGEGVPDIPQAAQPRPRIAGLRVRICRECHRPFAQKRIDQDFHNPSCRRKWHARIESRMREAYAAGMAMRSKKPGAFSALTNLFDRYIAEDRRRDTAYRQAAKAANCETQEPPSAAAGAGVTEGDGECSDD